MERHNASFMRLLKTVKAHGHRIKSIVVLLQLPLVAAIAYKQLYKQLIGKAKPYSPSSHPGAQDSPPKARGYSAITEEIRVRKGQYERLCFKSEVDMLKFANTVRMPFFLHP